VFAAPARSTLAAASYAQALELNRQATGRGLSIQAWCIVPKIRDIDTLLRENHRLQGLLRECHPELCWWALNGKRPMRYNKKQREGQQERLAVLGRYFPACRLLFEQVSRAVQRRHVAHDDIIDAMVCAVTANYGIDRFRTVPARPPVDGQGLPMEMVYCEGSRPRQK